MYIIDLKISNNLCEKQKHAIELDI